jgi:hypothetical protein
MSGSDNSLTAFFRGLSNLLGTTAPSFIQAGENLISGGLPITQGGLDMTGTGFGTTETGLQTLQPSIDFYNKLLSGDPSATAKALGPTAANISAITSGAISNATAGMPAGGFRAATLAGLPQAQAAQVGNAALALQPTAAQALGALGGEQAQIGGTQAQIGQSVAGTGLDVSRLGQALAQMGFNFTQQDIQDLIAKMNSNIQGGTSNTFNQWAQGIAALLGGGAAVKKACWIAEAIYGVDDPRTHLVRAYLNGPFQQTAFGSFLMSLYLEFGQWVAEQVRRRSWLKEMFRPIFNRALRSAVRWRLGS